MNTHKNGPNHDSMLILFNSSMYIHSCLYIHKPLCKLYSYYKITIFDWLSLKVPIKVIFYTHHMELS